MKKALLLAAALSIVNIAWAAAPGEQGGMSHGKSGAMMEQHRKNMEGLNLTDAQKQQMKALRQQHQAEMQTLREKHRQEVRALLTAEQQQKFDAHHAEMEGQHQQKMDAMKERREKRQNKGQE